MEKVGSLFSFSGRTSRLGYWRIQLLCSFLGGLSLVSGLLLAVSTRIGALASITFIGFAPVLIMGWAALVRRLHDRNKSAWWLLLFYVAPIAMLGVAQAPWTREQIPEAVLALLVLAALGLEIWSLVEIGLLRGAPGENRFGPASVY